MKIMTITTGISLKSPKQRERIIQAAEFNQKAKDFSNNKNMKFKQPE